MPELVPQIVEAIILILDTFNKHFDEFLMAGIKIILGLIEGLIKSIPNILRNLPTILMAIINFFTAQKLVSAGLTLLKGLGTGLINGIPQLIRNIPNIISNLVSSFKNNGISAFKNIGSNLVSGLWNGINGSYTWIKNKIAGWVGNVMSFIKKLFGIHSPSTVMRDEVGKYLAQGLGVGFEKELGSVYSEMQNAIDLEQDKIQANLQTGGIYNKVYGTAPIKVNNNNTSILEVDGEKMAEVVNNVNSKISLQYAF